MAKKSAPKRTAKVATPKKAPKRERVTAKATKPPASGKAAKSGPESQEAMVSRAKRLGLPHAVSKSALDPNRSDNLVPHDQMVPAHLLVPGADPHA